MWLLRSRNRGSSTPADQDVAPGDAAIADRARFPQPGSSQTTESGAIETVRVDTSETAAGERTRPDASLANCTMTPAAHGSAASRASHKRAVFMVFISPR